MRKDDFEEIDPMELTRIRSHGTRIVVLLTDRLTTNDEKFPNMVEDEAGFAIETLRYIFRNTPNCITGKEYVVAVSKELYTAINEEANI